MIWFMLAILALLIFGAFVMVSAHPLYADPKTDWFVRLWHLVDDALSLVWPAWRRNRDAEYYAERDARWRS